MNKVVRKVRNAIRKTVRYIHNVSKEYFHYRGTILARGIAFSILVTIVPTIFIAFYIGSYIFINTPEIQEASHSYISQIIPITYSEQIIGMVESYMSDGQWKNMGLVGILMLFFTPHVLFSTIERSLTVVMRPPVQKRFAHRQLNYFLQQIVIMVLLFTVAFVSGWVGKLSAFTEQFFTVPASILFFSSKLPTVTLMTLSLAAIYRLSYHHTINVKVLFPVSLGLALIWQVFSSSASAIVAVTGRNEVMYGMMAGAIILLFLAYIFSVLLITGGVIIGRESDKDSSSKSIHDPIELLD